MHRDMGRPSLAESLLPQTAQPEFYIFPQPQPHGRITETWYDMVGVAPGFENWPWRQGDPPLIRLEHRIVIHRSPDDVFAYVSAPWNMPDWQEAVIEATVIGGQSIGPDTSVRVRRRFMGQTVTLELETTEFTPNERFAFASKSGPVALRGSVAVEPCDTGTTVVFTVSGEPNGLVALAGPFIEPTVRREMAENAARLKAVLERCE